MTKILLIRHGESVCNRQGRLQGISDSPLTETGLRQIALLSRRLAQIEFVALYSSDTGRALHTARAIAESTGHEIVIDERLRERHFGIFEGLTRREIERSYRDAYARYASGDPDYCIPGGESANTFRERVLASFHGIADRHPEKVVAVVTHGFVLDIMYRSAYRIALSEPRSFEIVNGAINRLRIEGGVWRVEVWADCTHLEEVPS